MMDYEDKSIFAKAMSPYHQVGIILIGIFVCDVLGKLFTAIGLMEVDQITPWTISVAGALFFAVFNSVFSLSSDDVNAYWSKSSIGYIILSLVGALMAWGFSGLSINEAGTYKWILIVVTISYLVFMSIIGFMRVIVTFAQREEWNQPKQRKRKGRK